MKHLIIFIVGLFLIGMVSMGFSELSEESSSLVNHEIDLYDGAITPSPILIEEDVSQSPTIVGSVTIRGTVRVPPGVVTHPNGNTYRECDKSSEVCFECTNCRIISD